MSTATPLPWPVVPERDNSRSGFDALFEHAPIAAARCNSQGSIVEMNLAFEEMFELNGIRRRGLRIEELTGEEWGAIVQSGVTSVASGERGWIQVETQYPKRPTKRIQWQIWREPNRNDHHVIVIAQVSERDLVCENNQLESDRWQAIGRLAGGVVHDFNNLLTGITLYCDLLFSSLDGCDRDRRYAGEIRSAIAQATALVQQLLVFARPRPVADGPLNLNEIASSMCELLTRLIGENIRLDLQLDADLGLVEIDAPQAQQLLLNLVLNARDALPNGGHIVIETSNCRFQPLTKAIPVSSISFPCVLFAVSDNGHGMSAETRQRIFEPFFTTKNSGQGTGLGLTTVRNIVTAHHGLIHFDSAPGQGTRAMVLFPRALLEAPAELRSSSAISAFTPMKAEKKETQL
jgi:two-component system, cell cycle sensor histidine kinase and response regulator CckA